MPRASAGYVVVVDIDLTSFFVLARGTARPCVRRSGALFGEARRSASASVRGRASTQARAEKREQCITEARGATKSTRNR